MKTINKLPVVVALAVFILMGLVRAQASELLFSQFSDGQSAYGPSELWNPAGVNSEVADDFDVAGNIDRVFASDYPVLFWLRDVLPQCTSVFDFGGHVGVACKDAGTVVEIEEHRITRTWTGFNKPTAHLFNRRDNKLYVGCAGQLYVIHL